MLRTGHIFLWSLAVFGHTSTTRAGWVFFSYEKIFCEDKCMIKTALFSDSASQCDTCSKRILGEQGWFDVIYSTATKLICSKTTCKMRKSQQCLTWFHKDLACGLWHATYTPNTSTLNQTCWKCRLERNDHTKRSKLNTGKIPSKQSRDIVFFHIVEMCAAISCGKAIPAPWTQTKRNNSNLNMRADLFTRASCPTTIYNHPQHRVQ